MKTDYALRKLETNEDMRLIQTLEREVWDMEPVPTHQTFTASKNGGIIVGAFHREKLIGFCYGFAGFRNGKVYLCSHMMGIHPVHQSKGIGFVLKEEQRRLATEAGYDLITWTFDPLESRNAYLNTSRLYGISDTYLENCYGDMDDGLNRGLPTDRLQIAWHISSSRVANRWQPDGAAYFCPVGVETAVSGYPRLIATNLPIPKTVESVEIPVPEDFQAMKKDDFDLALDWRLKIRRIFQELFASGFALIGVRRTGDGIHYYRFIQRHVIPLAYAERGESE